MTLYAGGWRGGPPEQNAPLVDDPWADVADLEPRHSPFAANIFVPRRGMPPPLPCLKTRDEARTIDLPPSMVLTVSPRVVSPVARGADRPLTDRGRPCS